jgi:hypothetical protein
MISLGMVIPWDSLPPIFKKNALIFRYQMTNMPSPTTPKIVGTQEKLHVPQFPEQRAGLNTWLITVTKLTDAIPVPTSHDFILFIFSSPLAFMPASRVNAGRASVSLIL